MNMDLRLRASNGWTYGRTLLLIKYGMEKSKKNSLPSILSSTCVYCTCEVEKKFIK